MAVMTSKDHQKMAPMIPVIQKWANLRQIPYDMLYRQVWQESHGNPKAKGDFGKSYGLLQINENSAAKDMKADVSKLLDPSYNLDIGTGYIQRIKAQLQHLLPKDQREAWALIFMAYNSGIGYTLKALQRLRAKGDNNPTLQKAIAEMRSNGFGRTPIFAVTVPYATFVATGREMSISEILGSGASQVYDIASIGAKVAVKPQVSLPLVLAIGAGLYFWSQSKKQRAHA